MVNGEWWMGWHHSRFTIHHSLSTCLSLLAECQFQIPPGIRVLGFCGEDFAEQLNDLGPWGQSFPEPLFEGRFVVEDKRVVGGAHLKMSVRPIDGNKVIDAIAFGRLPEDLHGSDTIDLVYKLDINHFRGHKTCQLMVEQIIEP